MSATLDKDDYRLLATLSAGSSGRLRLLLHANGCANWSVCPECKTDDFNHAHGCSLYRPHVDAQDAGIRNAIRCSLAGLETQLSLQMIDAVLEHMSQTLAEDLMEQGFVYCEQDHR